MLLDRDILLCNICMLSEYSTQEAACRDLDKNTFAVDTRWREKRLQLGRLPVAFYC